MRKTMIPMTLLLGTLLLPGAAGAQAMARASATIDVNLPVVLPQLVVVAPGVQVVPEVDEEVFFTNGFYWVRHGDGWYRSKSHRHGWVLVPGHRVPTRIAKYEPGRYRRWKPEKGDHGVRDHGRGEGRHGAREASFKGGGDKGGGSIFRGGGDKGGGGPIFKGGGKGGGDKDGGRGEKHGKHGKH
jgi:hypothetical protein